ncbi:type IV pilus modification PilV family protein [Thermodesulfatator indicus]
MEQIVLHNKGMSLIEVLVSMVILLIIFVSALEAMRVYTIGNLEIELKNAAIQTAQSCMEEVKYGTYCFNFNTCNATYCSGNYTFKTRNINKNFEILFTNPSTLQKGILQDIEVVVKYQFRGKTHEIKMEGKTIL